MQGDLSARHVLCGSSPPRDVMLCPSSNDRTNHGSHNTDVYMVLNLSAHS